MAETIPDSLQGDDQNRQPKGTLLQSDGVEFEAILPDELKAISVLCQAFDNQWLPRSLLKEAIKAGGVTPKLEQQRIKLVRAEYIRSLLNCEQVVINRAFLYNNEIIYRDYLSVENNSNPDEIHNAQVNREAFKRLLQDGVIIPFLLYERSPVEPVKFSTLSLS